MRIVLLAAGVGSRLGSPIPKPLTTLADGRSIMARQVESLTQNFPDALISIVVGFKKDMILEAFPQFTFVYNENFGETNTSKSLLRALKNTDDGGVLWLNGDVVFDESLPPLLRAALERDSSFISVNTASVGDEEVKYDLSADGSINRLSKQVPHGLGEAVGVNFVSGADKAALIRRLQECRDDDYFERGIELTIEHDGTSFVPLDVTEAMCIEVDFADDLERVNAALRTSSADE